MGQQPGCGQATGNRARRSRGRGHTVFTARARVLRIDVPEHLDLARDVLDLLGHVLSDFRLGTPAIAGALLLGHVVKHVTTWKVIADATPAVALGTALGAEFTLLRVVRPLTPIIPSGPPIEGPSLGEMTRTLLIRLEALQAQVRQEAEEYMETVAARLRGRGLSVRIRVAVEDQPATAIVSEEIAPPVDLIALETHGRRGLKRLFLGSVADKVIRGARVPVLVHRPVFQS